MADKAEKYSFIVVKYPKQETAAAALNVVLGLAKQKVVKLKDAVAITKTEKGKIKLHQTKDDTAKKGFLKGGAIGVLFALLFGPVGWVAAGAALGTGFAMFDRGIKNKLLKELGEKMTPQQSALAVLVEDADWEKALGRMADQNFQGEVIVQELVAEHLAAIEKLVDVPATTEAVPEEVKLEAAPAETAPAEAAPVAASAEAAPVEAAPAKAAGVVFWDDASAAKP
jgi:uncharacterized membrane protein